MKIDLLLYKDDTKSNPLLKKIHKQMLMNNNSYLYSQSQFIETDKFIPLHKTQDPEHFIYKL
jgi:hypothetical protein